jgi:hypothetical protein
MNNTIVYHTKEKTRRDAGNTSAKRIATTLNHHLVEANNHKALKGTTLNHQELSITQDRSIRERKTTLNHPWTEAQQRLTIHDRSLST